VGVGDRLPLEADFLVADRDGLGDVLGADVLAQPDSAHFGLLGADVQPLFRAGHRVIGGGPGGVPALDVAAAGQVLAGVPRVLGAAAEIPLVVGVEGLVLRALDAAVSLDPRGRVVIR
jgi:hypothetical protein